MTDKNFIDESLIWGSIAANAAPAPARIDEILAKAMEGNGLESADVAALLAPMPREQEQSFLPPLLR